MTSDTRQSDLEALHARVAELERANALLQAENAELAARTNAVVAAAQDRVYWLDRWHVDLNALMRKPGAAQFRGALRAVRAVVRFAKQAKRQLLR